MHEVELPVLPNCNSNMAGIKTSFFCNQRHDITCVDARQFALRAVQERLRYISVSLAVAGFLLGSNDFHELRIGFEVFIEGRVDAHVVDVEPLGGCEGKFARIDRFHQSHLLVILAPPSEVMQT